MSLAHHPSEELLLDFAAGRLERGPGLVVQAHLNACPLCRGETGRFEAVGGALLGALPQAELAEGALAQALARLDEPPPTPPPSDKIRIDLPEMLADESFGPRRWLAPGLWLRLMKKDPGSRFNTYLLHSAPGRRLPRHSHEGAEYVCVLEGAFADGTGRYDAGDFACGDDELVHAPKAEPGPACVCLIATEGRLRMRSAIAHAIQLYAGV
jgi:putative transcriptional regulator